MARSDLSMMTQIDLFRTTENANAAWWQHQQWDSSAGNSCGMNLNDLHERHDKRILERGFEVVIMLAQLRIVETGLRGNRHGMSEDSQTLVQNAWTLWEGNRKGVADGNKTGQRTFCDGCADRWSKDPAYRDWADLTHSGRVGRGSTDKRWIEIRQSRALRKKLQDLKSSNPIAEESRLESIQVTISLCSLYVKESAIKAKTVQTQQCQSSSFWKLQDNMEKLVAGFSMVLARMKPDQTSSSDVQPKAGNASEQVVKRPCLLRTRYTTISTPQLHCL